GCERAAPDRVPLNRRARAAALRSAPVRRQQNREADDLPRLLLYGFPRHCGLLRAPQGCAVYPALTRRPAAMVLSCYCEFRRPWLEWESLLAALLVGSQ